MHPVFNRFVRSLAAAGCLAALVFAGRSHAQPAPPPLSPDRVTFFTEPNFKGEALTIEAGASVENLDRMQRSNQRPWSLAISSVRVEGAAKATVFSATGFSGDRLEITRSITDLYGERRSRDGGATWDRSIASVTVTGPQRTVVPQPVQVAPPVTVVVVPTPAPRGPVGVQDVRPRLDRRTAEMIVQRAFREVLNRPADPEGLRTYRDRLMHEGWTEGRVIEQLQRSSEARAVKADEAIGQAYQEVLGREPDAKGLAHYRAKWRDGWTQGQIRDDLRRSAEGRENYIRNTITRAYREVLGREPDPSGYAIYAKAMRERGYTDREVRAALKSGDEYRQKQRKR